MANILNSEITQQVFTIFLIPVITALATYIVRLLTAKTDSIESNAEMEKIKSSFAIAFEEIKQAVETINQTYVNDLKAEGKFTSECWDLAKEKARVEFKANCPKSVLEAMKKELTEEEFNTWIDSKIDCVISENKKKSSSEKQKGE